MRLRDIIGFTPEQQEELEKRFGKTPSSLEAVKSFDDCVIKEEKTVVSQVEEGNKGQERCPLLGKRGDYFYFCQLMAAKNIEVGDDSSEKPGFRNAIYNSKVSHLKLQIWCMRPKEKYCKCMYFKEESQIE